MRVRTEEYRFEILPLDMAEAIAVGLPIGKIGLQTPPSIVEPSGDRPAKAAVSFVLSLPGPAAQAPGARHQLIRGK